MFHPSEMREINDYIDIKLKQILQIMIDKRLEEGLLDKLREQLKLEYKDKFERMESIITIVSELKNLFK